MAPAENSSIGYGEVAQYDVIGRSSFSGSDIQVWGFLAGAHPSLKTAPVKLEPQTITISSFREKVPVRGLGNTNVLGFTRGPRTYAGSLINTVIERHPLYELIEAGKSVDPSEDAEFNFSYDEQVRRAVTDDRYTPDALPPLNLVLALQNEMGNRASIVILGVEFVNDGLTMSVEDVLTENTYQYVARDAVILRNPHSVIGVGFDGIDDIATTDDFDPWNLNESAEDYIKGNNQHTSSFDLAAPAANDSHNESSFEKSPMLYYWE